MQGWDDMGRRLPLRAPASKRDPEIELGTAKMRLDAARVLDFSDLLLLLHVQTDRIQRKRGRLVLNFQRILVHPHRDFFASGQPILCLYLIYPL